MNLPSEISAVIRAAAKAVNTHGAIKAATLDEVPERVLARKRIAHDAAIAELAAAMEKFSVLARRPSEPLDIDKLLEGTLRFFDRVGEARDRAAGRVKRIIDVKPGR